MDIKFLVYLFLIGVFSKTCHGFAQHYGYDHGGNSEYVHSNDTMVLSLYENTELKVASNSRQALEFTFTNRGSPSHFSFSKTSEDGMLGRLQATEAFLQQDDSTTIKVNNIVIPERPHNSKVTLTLTVSRDSPISKRSAQQGGGSFNGGGNNGNSGGGGSFNGGGPNGNSGGGGSFNGGGQNGNSGGGGSFDDNNHDQYHPGGNGGQGGSFNDGGHNGNSNGGGSFGGNDKDPYHPGGNGGQGGSFNDGGSNGNNGGGGSFGGNDKNPYNPGGNGGQGGSYNGGSHNGNSGGGGGSYSNRNKHSRNDRPDFNTGNNVGSKMPVVFFSVIFSYLLSIAFGGNSSRKTFIHVLIPCFLITSLLQYSQGQGQGGQIGNQGGSMGGGGGFYPNNNNNNNNNQFPNNNGNRVPNYWNDPSNRREITLTVEFTVVDSDEAGDREEHDPWIQAVYAANSKGDTCRDISQSFCGDKWWWVQFTTADSGSGIRKIDMDHSRPTNGGRPDFNTNQDDSVYFRYKNFVVGSDNEVEVVAGTSCCNPHMRIEVTDVDGNQEEFTAKSDKYGESTYVGNLTKTAFWGIIGGVIAVVLIIIAVSIWCCVRNKCAGYSNPNAS